MAARQSDNVLKVNDSKWICKPSIRTGLRKKRRASSFGEIRNCSPFFKIIGCLLQLPLSQPEAAAQSFGGIGYT
jgi:hypothetical protein